jgi:hypothetical protein
MGRAVAATFEAYASPSPAQPLFQAAVGNLNRRSPTTMGTQNPDCGSLLLISGQKTSSQTSRSCGVLLTETVARHRSSIIGADKLPLECRSVTRRKFTQALERDAIVRSLQDNGADTQESARALGMSRPSIYRKTNGYGIA